MNTQHTPGPWSVEIDHRNNDPEFIRAHVDGEIYDLASVLCDETGNATANARLIAAAPDLLHALQMIDSNAAESVEWIRRVARTAIAKAKGENA